MTDATTGGLSLQPATKSNALSRKGPKGGWTLDVDRLHEKTNELLLVRIVPDQMVNNKVLEWGAYSFISFMGLGVSWGFLFGGVIFHSLLLGILFPVVFTLLGAGVQSFCRKKRDYPVDGDYKLWTVRDNSKPKLAAAEALFGHIGPSFEEFPGDVIDAFDELTSVDTDQTSEALTALLVDELYVDDVVDIMYRLASTSNKNAFVSARSTLDKLYCTKQNEDRIKAEQEAKEERWRAELAEALRADNKVVQEKLLRAQPDYAEDFAALVEKHQRSYDPATHPTTATGTPNSSLN